jgi:hypothetical protein
VYVNNLAIAMKDPQFWIIKFENNLIFKLKESSPVEFNPCFDCEQDVDDTLCMAPKKYVQRMINGYVGKFGERKKKNVQSPINKDSQPELDTPDGINANCITKYQSLVSVAQWTVSLRRFDIPFVVMTLSSVRSMRLVRHLELTMRCCPYLVKFPGAKIRFRTRVLDHAGLTPIDFDEWSRSIYGDVKEEMPNNSPKRQCKVVTSTKHFDAGLYGELLTGRSVTGIPHVVNQTPYDWFCKKLPTVKTATFGFEFGTSRTCVRQIVDIRQHFRYLGVHVIEHGQVFGDNESMIKSAIWFDAKLHERYVALSFHRVKEGMASDKMTLTHILSHENPADGLSKHWTHNEVWHTLETLLSWSGDTMECFVSEEDHVARKEKQQQQNKTVLFAKSTTQTT